MISTVLLHLPYFHNSIRKNVASLSAYFKTVVPAWSIQLHALYLLHTAAVSQCLKVDFDCFPSLIKILPLNQHLFPTVKPVTCYPELDRFFKMGCLGMNVGPT